MHINLHIYNLPLWDKNEDTWLYEIQVSSKPLLERQKWENIRSFHKFEVSSKFHEVYIMRQVSRKQRFPTRSGTATENG